MPFAAKRSHDLVQRHVMSPSHNMSPSQAQVAMDVVTLVNQIISRWKEEALQVVGDVYPIIASTVLGLVQANKQLLDSQASQVPMISSRLRLLRARGDGDAPALVQGSSAVMRTRLPRLP